MGAAYDSAYNYVYPQNDQVPEKTLKENVKENKQQINELRRENNRQKMRLEIEIKKLQKDLQKKISMKEPAGQKLIAQKIIKTQKMIDKTDKLDAQLQTVIFELESTCANQAYQKIMLKTANIMSGANNRMKELNFEETAKKFMAERERMNAINEYAEDLMLNDEEEIEDEDVAKLISDLTQEQVAKKKKKIDIDLEEHEINIDDI